MARVIDVNLNLNLNLTPKEAAARLRVKVDTLKNWRCQRNKGPRFIKYGRVVLYPLAEIEAWEKANLHVSVHTKAEG